MATEFSRKEFLDAYFGYLATEDDSLFSLSAQTTDLCGRKPVLALRKFIQDLVVRRLGRP